MQDPISNQGVSLFEQDDDPIRSLYLPHPLTSSTSPLEHWLCVKDVMRVISLKDLSLLWTNWGRCGTSMEFTVLYATRLWSLNKILKSLTFTVAKTFLKNLVLQMFRKLLNPKYKIISLLPWT